MPENLLNCSMGINCRMFLCATSISAENTTYFVNSAKKGTLLHAGQCLTHRRFTHSKILQGFGSDVANISFNFVQAMSDHARSMLSNGLRRMCPRAFDPRGELAHNKCNS